MATQLTIGLPKGTGQAELEALQAELQQLSGVKGSGVYTPRGVSPGDIQVWIQVAGAILALVPKLVDLLRRHKIEKATITLPSGAKIEVDQATAAEIEKLVAAAQAKA